MRSVDRWAIDEQGVAGLELMERAGEAVARAVERIVADGPVTIVCGKGNNGGDGFVAARHLRRAGHDVSVVLTVDPGELEGDARSSFERLPGEPPSIGAGAIAARPATGGATVDALLGTGFQGPARGAAGEAIRAINARGGEVVSVDVPSGVDASAGTVVGDAVLATRTVTFHAAKPGLWVRPGKDHAGEVETVDIGIPRGAPGETTLGLVRPAVVAELATRRPAWTKFRSGQVLVVGGSRGLTGAPAMTALAAMRAGAGYVTVCVPASVQPVVATAGPREAMTRPLADRDGAFAGEEALPEILELAARGGAVALGPGLGRSDGAFELARRLVAQVELPVVIDADGLNAYAGELISLRGRGAATVLTPHAGELARLLGRDSEEIEARRLASVREAAELAGAITVLKGDDTLVADPAGRVAVSPGGTPALASAGTGDVLTGVIAALLAQGLDPFTAAAAGVWLHAEAGREAARRLGIVEGVIAGDVIDALPAARRRGIELAGGRRG